MGMTQKKRISKFQMEVNKVGSKLVFISELKGKVFDMKDDYALCTGYCLVDEESTNKLMHIQQYKVYKDELFNLYNYHTYMLLVEDDVYDAIRGKSVIEIDLESEITKACNEVVNRYQQISTMKDSASKTVIQEYCRKIEEHLQLLLMIKGYIGTSNV